MSKEPDIIIGESGATEAGWHRITTFLECPKKYQLESVRNITRPQTQTPDYFAIGSLLHAGKAKWFSMRFAVGPKADRLIAKAMRDEAELQRLPVTVKALQMASTYMAEYIAHWSKRALPSPIAAEYKLGPAPLKKDDPFYLYRTARLDDVSRYPDAGDALCIGETKTTSGSIESCARLYRLHGQPLLQVVLWKMAKEGEAKHGPVAGVMLDIIQKGYGGEPCKFGREFIPVTQRSIDWYVENMRHYLRAAGSVEWDTNAPRNIGACTKTIGRMLVPCTYLELCQHGRSATINYVLPGGMSLLRWKPNNDQSVPPWE